jgi:hypothetical protein
MGQVVARIVPLLSLSLAALACGGSGDSGGLSNPWPSSPSTSNTGGSGADAAASTSSGPGQGPPSSVGGAPNDASAPPTSTPGDAAPPPPPHPGSDAGSSPPPDAGASPGSGPPPRNGSCTPLSQQNGTAVDTNHGRLDGTLVYVLPIDGSSSCNGDSAHVHLQVEVSGSVYDVAVDIGKSGDEVGWYQQDMAVPGGAWSEGWHGADSLGYSSLGLGSGAFTMLAPSSMGSEVESLLASTSKISVFCTGYTPGDNGCHDVHYQDGTSQDGAIVLDPTAATSPVVFFRFVNQSF